MNDSKTVGRKTLSLRHGLFVETLESRYPMDGAGVAEVAHLTASVEPKSNTAPMALIGRGEDPGKTDHGGALPHERPGFAHLQRPMQRTSEPGSLASYQEQLGKKRPPRDPGGLVGEGEAAPIVFPLIGPDFQAVQLANQQPSAPVPILPRVGGDGSLVGGLGPVWNPSQAGVGSAPPNQGSMNPVMSSTVNSPLSAGKEQVFREPSSKGLEQTLSALAQGNLSVLSQGNSVDGLNSGSRRLERIDGVSTALAPMRSTGLATEVGVEPLRSYANHDVVLASWSTQHAHRIQVDPFANQMDSSSKQQVAGVSRKARATEGPVESRRNGARTYRHPWMGPRGGMVSLQRDGVEVESRTRAEKDRYESGIHGTFVMGGGDSLSGRRVGVIAPPAPIADAGHEISDSGEEIQEPIPLVSHVGIPFLGVLLAAWGWVKRRKAVSDPHEPHLKLREKHPDGVV